LNIFILLLLISTSFILFVKIPAAGPVYFSIMFLPVYIISTFVIIVTCVGFWFYGPIIAHNSTGQKETSQNLFGFIKKHNISLVYIILILAIITTMIFSVINFIHYGSMKLTISMAKSMLTSDLKMLFAAIPSDLLKLTELSFIGTEVKILKSLISELFFSYQIGGFILGIILSSITVVLFSSFISLTATISTHAYILLERNLNVDDSAKIRPLIVLVLILVIILLFKKIFL